MDEFFFSPTFTLKGRKKSSDSEKRETGGGTKTNTKETVKRVTDRRQTPYGFTGIKKCKVSRKKIEHKLKRGSTPQNKGRIKNKGRIRGVTLP